GSLPPRPPAPALLERPPLRRPEDREGEPQRLPPPGGPLAGARAIRFEGRGGPQQPLHRREQAGRLVALPPVPPPRAPALRRTALRRALRAGYRRRQLRWLRGPHRLDELEVPRGARPDRRLPRPSLPGEVERQGRLGVRRRLGEAARLRDRGYLQAPPVRLRQAHHLHRQGVLAGPVLRHLRPLRR